jgi:hypothetical protein
MLMADKIEHLTYINLTFDKVHIPPSFRDVRILESEHPWASFFDYSEFDAQLTRKAGDLGWSTYRTLSSKSSKSASIAAKVAFNFHDNYWRYSLKVRNALNDLPHFEPMSVLRYPP